MVESINIILNIIGLLLSILSVYLTKQLYFKYSLNRTGFYISTAISLFLWNLGHIFLNYLPQTEYNKAKVVWYFVFFCGQFIAFNMVAGYSMIRNEVLTFPLLIYATISGGLFIAFVEKPSWAGIIYDKREGWVIHIENQYLWSFFTIFVLVMVFVEIIIPMSISLKHAVSKDRPKYLLFIVLVLLAVFSNGLLPILKQLGWPQTLRFLLVNLSFFFFFFLLSRNIFIGIHDKAVIYQIILANHDGVPYHIHSEDRTQSLLASGAIIGINSVLEEISKFTQSTEVFNKEVNRRIELGTEHFFISIQKSVIIIFHYSHPTGVVYSKFRSLARIFRDSDAIEILIPQFIQNIEVFFS
ncbi:MAG: hypothetical protein OEY49_16525 [Candidatus Heimdallarchaeota archaeon]|nr:hypothetical protein [Candidatus Heimdallarchaeota archaeon]